MRTGTEPIILYHIPLKNGNVSPLQRAKPGIIPGKPVNWEATAQSIADRGCIDVRIAQEMFHGLTRDIVSEVRFFPAEGTPGALRSPESIGREIDDSSLDMNRKTPFGTGTATKKGITYGSVRYE